METFDVREFDQYLPVSGHSGGASELAHGPNAWSRKGAGTSSSATGEAAQLHRAHIKTEQLSPSRSSESSRSEYDAYVASGGPPFSGTQCDYTDLQSSSYYSPYSSYPSGLYPYPYFHSSRRPYGNPVLPIPQSHSPTAGWDQPVYTTLSRPWHDAYANRRTADTVGGFLHVLT